MLARSVVVRVDVHKLVVAVTAPLDDVVVGNAVERFFVGLGSALAQHRCS